MQINDRDIMLDLLTSTKYISTGYHTAVLEAANDRVRNTLIQLNNEEMNFQKQLFDIMHDRGWYQVEAARTSQTGYHPMATATDPMARATSPMGMASPMATAQYTNQPPIR
ncbi:MAG: spore coat protein [Bacillota bacterium]